jgi:Tfp pilus assembly protein PilV
MSEEEKTNGSIMDHAVELEERWNWMGAAESYEEALRLVPDKDNTRIGDILERKAYTLHKAAFQNSAYKDFEKGMHAAIDTYRKAKSAYEGISGPSGNGRRLRCDSMIAYLSYWLADTHDEKKSLVDDAWKKAKSSLSTFEAAGNSADFALTFSQVSFSAAFSYDYDGNSEGREVTLREALSYAEKSVRHLSSSGRPSELARAHVKCTGLLVAIEKDFTPYGEKDKVDLDAWDHWTKARGLSETTALVEIPFLIVLQSWPAACSTDERNAIYAKAKDVAERSKDRFVIGCVLDGLAQRKLCLARSAEKPAIDVLANEGLNAATASKENLDVVHFVSPNVIEVWISVPGAGYHFSRASEEEDPKPQRELFFKAHPLCIEQLKQANESGYPDVVCAAHFMLGSVLKGLGASESGIDMKRSYLEESVRHLEKAVAADKVIHPTMYYPQGQDLLSLAEAHFEIAQITTDREKKKSVLREAVLRRREALGLCEKELYATQDMNPDASGELAVGYHTTGKWARELCGYENDTDRLGMVAGCLEKAVMWYTKAGQPSQSAECNWEAAEAYHELGEFRKASERFELAADDYKKAAESVPRLKEFYADHAIYMRAWGEIEQANYHHLRQEPGQAKEHYDRASAMHKSSRRWSYLATNYSAWSEVEHAEDLSRNEKSEEAMKAFEEAARLFQESKNAIHDQVAKIEDADEKQLARNLERVANLRREYCRARIVVEKARAFDKQGDVSASSDKYGQAAEQFEKMLPELESEQDRKELQLMAHLSRAWQAMAKAESETSPDYYEAASDLFEKARDLSTGEKAKLLVAGHSRFCKALAVGARFVETGDVALHAVATRHIESAADNYLKAGYQKESVYAKASKLLFDGYVHMGKASAEDDQAKRAKLYMMAEKVLHESAISYEDAKQPGKRDQVLRLLGKVKEERELALSLTEVLRAPDAISSTAAFPTPTPSHEKATGLERFEHTDIEVILVAHPNHLHVGQDIEIELEMTNAGKGAARLTRVEGLIPNGFEVVSKPERCMIDGDCLDLRGRRLEALRTEVVKFVMKPTIKGKFSLNPRIQYQDESGAHVDKDTAPVEVIVKEMGISGWLKGT